MESGKNHLFGTGSSPGGAEILRAGAWRVGNAVKIFSRRFLQRFDSWRLSLLEFTPIY
jgi:hypothetical protein